MFHLRNKTPRILGAGNDKFGHIHYVSQLFFLLYKLTVLFSTILIQI